MYIKIKVNTETKNEKMVKKTDTSYEVSVKEKPERNMANKKVVELVAKQFKLSPHKVRIVSGHHSPSKILSLDIPE